MATFCHQTFEQFKCLIVNLQIYELTTVFGCLKFKFKADKMKAKMMIEGLLFWTFLSVCRGLCPLMECDCNDDHLKVECVGMALKEIPITLNPHISTLKIHDSFLKRLDAALQFYPHLKVS